MRLVKVGRLAAALGLLVLLACPAATTPPLEVEVGIHDVNLAVPTGWQHSDHGQEQRFAKGIEQISLADLGAATPEGFANEIRDARKLFRLGQEADARATLAALRPRRFFESDEDWSSIRTDWRRLTRVDGDRETDSFDRPIRATEAEIEQAFAAIIDRVRALPTLDLDTLATRELDELGHDSLRDIASKQATSISGRPALRIDTWDRLAHTGRRSHLFILNKGNLLCLRTELGKHSLLAPAFEGLAANLKLRDDHSSGS